MKDVSLQMLHDSGLTSDWQTVCAGWRGFPLNPYYDNDNVRLPSEEVRDFAYDLLPSPVNPEEQYLLVGIIDAETNGGFGEAMARYGENLAAISGVSELVAKQKWRYAILWHLQRTTREYAVNDDYFPTYPWQWIAEKWNEIVLVHPIPEIESAYFNKEDFLLCLSRLRSWLAEERQFLTEMGQMALPLAPLV